MREFSADYLRATRRGMWTGEREALAPLALASRERVLDVGCGTGELSRVLVAETDGTVVGCDADRTLLRTADGDVSGVAGDARRLPLVDDAVDLVVCQALLINLADPAAAVEEFARVSSDLAAAIEPDNGAVTVESTVPAEEPLAARARRAYLEGVSTDVTLGSGAADFFESAAIEVLASDRYGHERTVGPPYDEDAIRAAARKASGEGLASDRETMLAGDLTTEAYEDLHDRWRAMGREAVSQMSEGTYRRTETVPFHVTVGRVA